MQEIEFVRYLKYVCNLAEGTVGARVANYRRIERYEGDLDVHFQADGMALLMRSLTYSTEDGRKSEPTGAAPHSHSREHSERNRHAETGRRSVSTIPPGRRIPPGAAPRLVKT